MEHAKTDFALMGFIPVCCFVFACFWSISSYRVTFMKIRETCSSLLGTRPVS